MLLFNKVTEYSFSFFYLCQYLKITELGVISKLVEFVISVRLKNPFLIQPLPGANVNKFKENNEDDPI